MTSRISAARRAGEWSRTRLITEPQRVALRRGVTLPGLESLKSRVSRWENGHATPDDFYRQLLREALGMDDRELGFELTLDENLAAAAAELHLRLAFAKAPDGALLHVLRGQTEAWIFGGRVLGLSDVVTDHSPRVAETSDHPFVVSPVTVAREDGPGKCC